MYSSRFKYNPLRKAAWMSPAAAFHPRDAHSWNTVVRPARDTVGESVVIRSGSRCPATTNLAFGFHVVDVLVPLLDLGRAEVVRRSSGM